jgi:hypothetical protein
MDMCNDRDFGSSLCEVSKGKGKVKVVEGAVLQSKEATELKVD